MHLLYVLFVLSLVFLLQSWSCKAKAYLVPVKVSLVSGLELKKIDSVFRLLNFLKLHIIGEHVEALKGEEIQIRALLILTSMGFLVSASHHWNCFIPCGS